jgi:pyridoxamine 5'-phosphate oxidase
MRFSASGLLCLAMRRPYKQPHEYFGTEHLVSHEPFGQFKKWFEEAVEYVDEPNAFCLSTATKYRLVFSARTSLTGSVVLNRDGVPSSRFLLMKGFDENGFKFYTNYDSRKGRELVGLPNIQSQQSTKFVS